MKVNAESVTLKITQSLFLQSGEEDTTNRKWFIPLYVLTNTHEHLFEITEFTTTIKVPIKGDWFIKLNSHGKSFLRVKYNEVLLERIIKAASQNKFSTPDKSTILSDTLSLMKADKVDMNYVMSVINSLKYDKD